MVVVLMVLHVLAAGHPLNECWRRRLLLVAVVKLLLLLWWLLLEALVCTTVASLWRRLGRHARLGRARLPAELLLQQRGRLGPEAAPLLGVHVLRLMMVVVVMIRRRGVAVVVVLNRHHLLLLRMPVARGPPLDGLLGVRVLVVVGVTTRVVVSVSVALSDWRRRLGAHDWCGLLLN